MTWNTPAPSYQPPAPQPTVPRGALTLGDVFSGAFRTVRAALGLFVRLTLAPLLLMLGSAAVYIVAVFALLAGGTPGPEQVVPIVLLSVGLFVAMVASYVLYYVCLGRMSVATIDLAEGRGAPTWDNLRERTPGLGRRVATLVVLIAIAVAVLYGLLLAAVIAVAAPWSGSTVGNESPPGLAVLLLLFPVLALAAVFVAVRLLYAFVVMAEEGHPALGALSRSWQLTRGAFWRTLGYWIVGSLVASVVSWIAQLVTLPFAAPAFRGEPELSPATVAYFVGTLLVSGAVALLLVPFQTVWVTLMYLGRRRELAGETVVSAWPPSQPSQGPYPPYAPPAPDNPYGGYGQQSGYPQPGGYPPPGYPQPGGYPPPGPAQPGSPPQG